MTTTPPRAARALLDTSVVIDPPADLARYAEAVAVSTITLAELGFGLHTADPVTNAARQLRFERILATFDPIPYSATAARPYGGLCASVTAQTRDPKPAASTCSSPRWLPSTAYPSSPATLKTCAACRRRCG